MTAFARVPNIAMLTGSGSVLPLDGRGALNPKP